MRRTVIAALLVLFVLASVPAQACQYWQCRESESTATCYMFFCNGSGCNDSYYAAKCDVYCTTTSGFGCWCMPEGICYEI
jgi:hypothetical protein